MSSVAIAVRNFLTVHPWTHVGTARTWTALLDQGYRFQPKLINRAFASAPTGLYGWYVRCGPTSTNGAKFLESDQCSWLVGVAKGGAPREGTSTLVFVKRYTHQGTEKSRVGDVARIKGL